jgi:hypothetical protein
MSKIVGLLVSVVLLAAAATSALAVVATAAALYGLYRGGRALARRHARAIELSAHQRAELLARAELQHRWYLDGDPRGIYGRFTPAR